jgi:hypothetical protein
LKPDSTLELDEKPNLPPGRVRVTLEPATAAAPSGPGWWQVLQQIWKEQAASGFQGRSRETIDADLDALRDEWEQRLAELEAIRAVARRFH